MGVTAKRVQSFLLGGDGHILKSIVMMIAQLYKYTYHCIVCTLYIGNCVVCELYLNKVAIKKKKGTLVI